MYLTFKELANLFADRRGADKADLIFYTVTDQADTIQPKGLYLSLDAGSGELSEAIANGAIAAVWEKREALPSYTPSQFPVFFTENPLESLRQLLRFYAEKLDGEKDKKMNTTKFHVLNNKLLNENDGTYDIAMMLKKVALHSEIDGGRG